MIGGRGPLALCAFAAAGLAGCRVGPEYVPPVPDVPARYRNGAAPSSGIAPDAEWWRMFGSQELNDLVARARHGNAGLAAAAERIRQADAQARIAGAALLPSLQAIGSDGPLQTQALQGQRRQHLLYNGGFAVSYELDVWGKNRSALDAAEASAAASRYARDVVEVTTTTGVATLYVRYLALLDRVDVARRTLARAKRVLADTVAEERQGLVPRQAVALEEFTVATFEAAVPPLDMQVAATRDALAIMIGELPERLRLSGTSLAGLRRPAIGLPQPSELLLRRPDVAQAEATLSAATADIRVARARFLPSFTFNLGGGVNALQGGTLPISPGAIAAVATYSALSNAAQPIFDGGALRGQLDAATAAYRETLVGTYRQTVLTAFGEVEDALSSLKETRREELARERALKAATASTSFAQSGLGGGTGTILTVLATQSAAFTAQDALVQSRQRSLVALVDLVKALGGGWRS